MRDSRAQRGFTLIEVLIVVSIVAVLAALVIPYYSGTAEDAKRSVLQQNRSVFQVQIRLYQADHLGQYPTIQESRLPQLTQATNRQGEAGNPGVVYPYGPYLADSPINPYGGSSRVTPVVVSGMKPAAVADRLGGWQYDVTNGAIWPNNPESYP